MNSFPRNFIATLLLSGFLLVLLEACQSPEPLPILGPKKLVENGDSVDTLYHQIQDFEFVNQNGETVNAKTFDNKIYVSDFIFTTCPSICPIMSKELKSVQEAYAEEDEVLLLSHTVDPERDSVAVLKEYAERIGANSEKWHFVTGDKDEVYQMGLKNYLVTMSEEEAAPGGFLHSAALVLVDKEKRIRGVYNGTDQEEVEKLIKDIARLLREYPTDS